MNISPESSTSRYVLHGSTCICRYTHSSSSLTPSPLYVEGPETGGTRSSGRVATRCRAALPVTEILGSRNVLGLMPQDALCHSVLRLYGSAKQPPLRYDVPSVGQLGTWPSNLLVQTKAFLQL